MTDDFLKDFEGELRDAAERRQASAHRVRRSGVSRVLVPAVAVASVAAFIAAVVIVGGGTDPMEETVATTGPTGPDRVSATFTLEALTAGSACTAPREVRGDAAGLQATDAYAIFRRGQRSPDAVADEETARLPVRSYYFAATRSPSGLGERFLLVPSPAVNVPCGAAASHGEGAGVCVVGRVVSRCFPWPDVREARAAALVEPGKVVGVVPDGVDRVVISAGGERVTATVIENAYLARVPGLQQGDRVTVTHVLESLDGCAPSERMRTLVPVLDKPANPGGVPPAVRKSLDIGLDSRVAAQYARIAGGGDGVTYWVIPQLRCEDRSLDADQVCIYPLFDGQEEGGGGGTACATVEEIEAGKAGWIHFPLRDGGDAAAGFAKPGATTAFARIDRDDYAAELQVKDGVFAGTLVGHELKGEVGGLEITFEVPDDSGTGPEVAVLNGTTMAGSAEEVMAELADVNYRRGVTGNFSEQNVKTSTVYYRPGFEWLGDRVAIYLGERHGIDKPRHAPITPDIAALGGDSAKAVVVAGADLVKR